MLSLCLSACLGLSGLRLVPLGTPVATPVPVPRLGLIRLAVDEKSKVGNGLFEGLSRRAGRAAAPATHSEECVADSEMSGGVAAASALVSSAIIAEGVQIVGTAVLLYLGQRWTGTETPVEAVSALIEYIQSLGVQGYALFSALMISLQVVPIAAAFVLTVSAGAIFGAVKGTAVVLSCSTASATISFYISRTLGRERLLDYAQKSPQCALASPLPPSLPPTYPPALARSLPPSPPWRLRPSAPPPLLSTRSALIRAPELARQVPRDRHRLR